MTKTINVRDESKDSFRELHQLYGLEFGRTISVMDFFEVLLTTFKMHNERCTDSMKKRVADRLLRSDYEIKN